MEDPEWFERAFAILEKAPRHYRELLCPLLIRAAQEAKFMPLVRHFFDDAFTLHLLAGGEPEPFLPNDPGSQIAAKQAQQEELGKL